MPDLTFSFEQFVQYTNPCVYAWRRGSTYLYIGFSKKGIGRPLSYTVGKHEDFLDTDLLELWFFETEKQAREKEKLLIAQHKPKYNKAGVLPRGRRAYLLEGKCSQCGKRFFATAHELERRGKCWVCKPKGYNARKN